MVALSGQKRVVIEAEPEADERGLQADKMMSEVSDRACNERFAVGISKPKSRSLRMVGAVADLAILSIEV